MNTQEINLKIAEMEGLRIAVDAYGTHFPVDSEGMAVDYTSDPKLIIENEIELGMDGWDYSMDGSFHCWGKNDGLSYFTVSDKDFGIATALARIEAFK